MTRQRKHCPRQGPPTSAFRTSAGLFSGPGHPLAYTLSVRAHLNTQGLGYSNVGLALRRKLRRHSAAAEQVCSAGAFRNDGQSSRQNDASYQRLACACRFGGLRSKGMLTCTPRGRTIQRLLAVIAMWISVSAARMAHADLQAGLYQGRTDATWNGSAYRTWGEYAETGAIVSRTDTSQSVGTSHWTVHGWGSAPAGPNGVAATGYSDGTNYYEFAIYVGTDGNLDIGTVTNSGAISWTVIAPPFGRVLTGHLAATTFLQSTNRYLLVGATTTDGHLFRFVAGVLPTLAGGWTDSSAGLSWATNNPMGVSTNPSQTIASLFAAHTPSSQALGMIRWNGSTWSTTNLGAPAGRHTCRTIASAQMSPSGFAGDERVVVACTSVDVSTGLDVAISTAYSSTSFTWSTRDTTTYYQAVAAVAHTVNALRHTSAIDIYGSELFAGALKKFYYDGTNISVTDLGSVGDQTIAGLMAAIPWGTTSRDFFVGPQNGRNLLYERYGGSAASAPQEYRALGDTSPLTLPGGIVDHYAEGKVSVWQGTLAASVINRPGTGGPTDWPKVFFLYSEDEGEAIHSPVQVPGYYTGSYNYQYVSDPTSAVTDQRTMYSVQIGLDTSSCSTSRTDNSVAIYSTYTTPSLFPTFTNDYPIVTGPGLSLDHPYADAQHRAGAPDLVHIAWWYVGSTIGYSCIAEGSNPTAPAVISSVTLDTGGPPRVTASDSGRVIIYYPTAITVGSVVVNTVRFCELYDTTGPGGVPDGIPDTCCINGTTCGPQVGWQTVDVGSSANNYPLSWSVRQVSGGAGPLVSGLTYIQNEYPVSMAVSESGDTLYYCFDKLETGSTQYTDSFCAVGTRDPSTGIWSWNKAPVALSGVTNDSHDQFAPEVFLTQEQGSYSTTGETAVFTFYDRGSDPSNYYYQVKRTLSTDRLATVFPARALAGGASSDPDKLPRHCFHPNARFIGDYAGSEGYIDHGQSIFVTVPNPAQIGTAMYTEMGSLGSWEQ